ncbi:Na+/melibiose symporter-like transporter [Ancylobacter aquaticus]|uniref:Na+/melibiose symporter-like transporter n=1 Tax=Ancylobacter aquaticus TaxID=100 RepID=A0A4R1I8W2_ANCAQ|nr:MFS transporter [Ancylobacter aquaticus]TCK31518.1 Na+/melibiose symporter-like transporter [Ancylobacter aquaticus]
MATQEARELPVRRLALYSLPALPLAALALPFYVIVPSFYAEALGLSLASVGTALLAIRILDAVADPFLGWASDHIAPAMGRRRALMLVATPVTALCAFMVFWPGAGAGIAYLVLWGLGLSLGYTALSLAYTAWGAEISPDYRGRARVVAAREAVTLLGTLLAIALPFAIGIGGSAGGFNGLAAMGVFVLVALPLATAGCVLGVPEPANRTRARLRFSAGLRHLRANRPFLRLIAAFLLNGIANAIPATLFLYFVADRIGAAALQGPLLFLYFLCGVAGLPLALRCAGRFGKHRAWCGAMAVACVVFAGAGWLGPGDVVPFALICAATGLLLAFDVALPPAIQADVIDVDTAASGEQRSGLYFALWALATKLALAIAVGVTFPLLDWAGYQPGDGAPSTEASAALAMLYAWLPIPAKLAAIALMWGFPLDETAQGRLRREIDAGAAAVHRPG